MITLRILLAPGRRGRVVDASGRSLPQPVPAPVIGSAEPLRIILLDPATLDPADPYGFDTGAPLRLTISGDWDPATIPVYATNALTRTAVGTYDLADPSGTRTAEALALLGVLAERLCAWELTAYGGDPESEADWAHPLSVVQFDAPLRQRADSLGGDPTEAPAVDLRGPAGPEGPAGKTGPTGPQGPKGDPQTPSDETPRMDGAGAAGTATTYARGDHRHPSDTEKVGKSGDTMTGPLRVADETASAVVAAGSVRVNNGYSDTVYGAGAIVDPTTGKTRILPASTGTLALQEGIAPAFSASSTYAVGDYCTHEGLLYKCTTAVSTAGAWSAANWTAVSAMSEMPAPGAPNHKVYAATATASQASGATVYAATTFGGDFSRDNGCVVVFTAPSAASGSSPQLNVDGTGARPIVYKATSGYAGVPASEIRTGKVCFCQFLTGNDITGKNLWVLLGWEKAPLASPAFTGTPTAPTAAAGTNTTQIATTAFVQTAVTGKADASALRYTLPAAVAVTDATSTAALADRAVNTVTVGAAVTTLNLTFPAAVAGYARDFFVRLDCAGTALATIALPSGETVDFGADALAGLTGASGVHLARLTEIAANHWLIAGPDK